MMAKLLNIFNRGALALALAVGVAGCSSDMSDLDAFMATVRAKPAKPIDPIPTFKPYETFIYSAQSLRAPFDVPVSVKEITRMLQGTSIKPDLDRPKEFLERFNFESLSMVGTVNKSGTLWVLINDGEGGVHRVKMGNYLGKDHGKIVAATETEISVVEIVPSGVGSWIERPRTIELAEKN